MAAFQKDRKQESRVESVHVYECVCMSEREREKEQFYKRLSCTQSSGPAPIVKAVIPLRLG